MIILGNIAEGRRKMKKALSFFVVMLLIVSSFSQNLISFITDISPFEGKEKEYAAVLERFSVFKASKVEQQIREAEEARRKELERLLSEELKRKRIEQTLADIKSGKTSLRKVFANTCFVGDSLINGLETYNILNSDKIISQVSARFSHLEDNLKKIITLNPKVLILHYGINMLWSDDTGLRWFIEDYSELVRKLKDNLPHTRIIVSSIFPVNEELAGDVIFERIPIHNTALKNMCKEIGVEFLDSTELVKECEEYYGSDGIHFSAGFYSEKWLPFIVESKEIIG